MYCSKVHSAADWASHKRACKQLAGQRTANCKLLAILTGSFKLRDASSGREMTCDLDELVYKGSYTVDWTFDDKAGSATFVWNGYEPAELLLPEQPANADPRFSNSLASEVGNWDGALVGVALRHGRVHSLANLPGTVAMTPLWTDTTADSAFFSLAINYHHFVTCLPWAPKVYVEDPRRRDAESPVARTVRLASAREEYRH